MRTILSIVALLVVAFGVSAQEPEAGGVRIEVDSAAMDVLDSYRHLLPPHEFDRGSWLIRSWAPHDRLFFPRRLTGAEYHLWQGRELQPRVRVEAPRFLDYNSVTLRLGDGSSTITITNGSAYNYMPWPNAPQGYRDARTLSFPLPR